MYKKLIFAPLFAVACVSAYFMACSETSVAGGVSEETNTLAGVLVDQSGKAVSRALVSAKHFDVDSLEVKDTTDADGRFELGLKTRGQYGISAQVGKSAFYKMVNFEGLNDTIDAQLASVGSISGAVRFSNDSVAAQVEVSIPGSPWTVVADEKGKFTISGVPHGSYPLKAESPDPIQYVDAVYIANVGEGSSSVFGPVSTEMLQREGKILQSGNLLASSGESGADLRLPVSTEYGLRSWWSMDYLTESKNKAGSIGDARGWSESMLVYGGAVLEGGVDGKSLALRGAGQYGVVEDDRGLLDSASSMFVEAWIRINEIKDEAKSYRKNVVGKVGFGSEGDKDVFSLAVVKGDCGASSASFAFFMADGSGEALSCGNAVVSSDPLIKGVWTYVVAVWDGTLANLYIDGVLVASKEMPIRMLGVSEEPIFFGKESIDLDLDDVRIGVSALGKSDVFYRFYLKEVQDD